MKRICSILALASVGLSGCVEDGGYEASAEATANMRSSGVVETTTTTAFKPPTTTTTAVRGPSLAIGCPKSGEVDADHAIAPFSHVVTAGAAPLAFWTIDYGDQKSYSTEHHAKAKGAVFEHTYTRTGTFTVTATVTDTSGLSDSDSCTFSWSRSILYDITTSTTSRGYYPPGGYNDVGCPKGQWVNGYYRRDGTYVRGYWRNSPTDGCGGG